ncbi:MAG TPA: hypothetical protein VHB98_05910, partial [Chloroflexota bacterium]|nr:hypothetical protein [Chloroflexota bacterium]
MHRTRLLVLLALVLALLVPAGLGAVDSAHAAGTSLVLTPSQIPAGTTSPVSVIGAGLPANTALTVKVDATLLASALTTNASGAFGPVTFTMPATLSAGTHLVTVATTSNQNQILAGVVLTVSGSTAGHPITLTPSTVNPGGTFSLTGSGFPPNTALTVKVDTIALTYSLLANAGGAIAATTFPVPSTLSAGAHTVTVAATSNQNQILASAILTIGGSTAGHPITLTPSTINAGGTFSLIGSGFPPNTALTVKVDSIVLTSALLANAGGAIAATTFTAPSTLSAGTHTVTVAATSNPNQILASATLTIGTTTGAPALVANPSTVQAGNQVALSGSGFGANELITLSAPGISLPTIQANGQGSFSATLMIPATESLASLPLTAAGQQTHRTASVTLSISRSSAAISL